MVQREKQKSFGIALTFVPIHISSPTPPKIQGNSKNSGSSPPLHVDRIAHTMSLAGPTRQVEITNGLWLGSYKATAIGSSSLLSLDSVSIMEPRGSIVVGTM